MSFNNFVVQISIEMSATYSLDFVCVQIAGEREKLILFIITGYFDCTIKIYNCGYGRRTDMNKGSVDVDG